MYEEEIEIVLCYPPVKIDRNQVKPNEFLKWAISDLKGGDKRSHGNALGNIKKAIHSRIDEIINSTHLVFCCDWKWKDITTEIKLKILKDLGIGRGDIARVITEERNTYEHRYILPSLSTIRAYREIAELWLNESYKKYPHLDALVPAHDWTLLHSRRRPPRGGGFRRVYPHVSQGCGGALPPGGRGDPGEGCLQQQLCP